MEAIACAWQSSLRAKRRKRGQIEIAEIMKAGSRAGVQ